LLILGGAVGASSVLYLERSKQTTDNNRLVIALIVNMQDIGLTQTAEKLAKVIQE